MIQLTKTFKINKRRGKRKKNAKLESTTTRRPSPIPHVRNAIGSTNIRWDEPSEPLLPTSSSGWVLPAIRASLLDRQHRADAHPQGPHANPRRPDPRATRQVLHDLVPIQPPLLLVRPRNLHHSSLSQGHAAQ